MKDALRKSRLVVTAEVTDVRQTRIIGTGGDTHGFVGVILRPTETLAGEKVQDLEEIVVEFDNPDQGNPRPSSSSCALHSPKAKPSGSCTGREPTTPKAPIPRTARSTTPPRSCTTGLSTPSAAWPSRVRTASRPHSSPPTSRQATQASPLQTRRTRPEETKRPRRHRPLPEVRRESTTSGGEARTLASPPYPVVSAPQDQDSVMLVKRALMTSTTAL